MGALVVVGGQLRGGDQMHAVLHRMGVGVANALDRIMIRDGQMRHPGAPRQKRQLGNRCGTIGISRMRMQIARHGGQTSFTFYGIYYYTMFFVVWEDP